MSMKYGSACGAINCSNNQKNSPHLSFFRFPKDLERSKKWLINTRRDDLYIKDVIYLYHNVRLCSLHFEDSRFMNSQKKNLVWNAVPTLFDVPNKPPSITLKRKLLTKHDTPVPKKSKVLRGPISETATCSNDDPSGLIFTHIPSKQAPTNVDCADPTILGSHIGKKSLPGKSNIETSDEEINKLHKIMDSLRRKCKYNSAKVVRLQIKCRELKKCRCICKCKQSLSKLGRRKAVEADRQKLKCIASKYMTKEAVNVLESQIIEPNDSKFGNRWNDNMKLFSLRNLYYSPQGYRFLSQFFKLPSIRTLQKYVESIKLHCGINENLFELLKQKIQGLPEHAKVVNLSVDEMSIMSHLSYDTATDCVMGVEDFGYKRTEKIANSVLVFHINGLFSNISQTLAYFFTSNAIKAAELTDIFLNIVSKLTEIGFCVKTCVCDQGANFREWRNIIGITEAQPYLVTNEGKMYFFYDSPHLLKSVRNNLFKFDIIHKVKNSEPKIASWNVIAKLYDSDSKRQFKLAPKLTKRSVQLPAFSKMKVSSAAQVLSHTVAVAIETLVACGEFSSLDLGTSEFCQKMNDLFDIFNCSNLKGVVKLRNAITATSNHLTVLSGLKEWIDSWVLVDNSRDCTKRVTCINGIKMNISALELLYNELIAGRDTYLMARKINQDGLENFFSLMRHKGGFCNNPSPKQFMAAFNNAALCKLFSCMSNVSSNCEVVDWSQLILDLKSEKGVEFSGSLSNTSDHPEEPALSVQNVQLPKALAEANSMRYVFGFVVRKLLFAHRCDICTSALTDDNTLLDDYNKIYTHFKSYDSVRKEGGLTVCSNSIYTFLEKCENRLETYFQQYAHTVRCGAALTELLMKVTDFPVECCESTKLMLLKIYVKLRMYYIIKFNNELRRSRGTNSKLLKFSHLGC